MGLVDDQGVVALEHPVALQLGEQDAVGHHLDAALLRRTVGEPHLVADGLPQLAAELLGDPLGDAAGRDPARLGVADHRSAGSGRLTATEREADLRQLRGLSRPRLAGDDHHLVVADRLRDVVATCRDRKVGREVDAHSAAILPVAGGRDQPDCSGQGSDQRDGVGLVVPVGLGMPSGAPLPTLLLAPLPPAFTLALVHHPGLGACHRRAGTGCVPDRSALRCRRPRHWRVRRHRARRGGRRRVPPRSRPAATTGGCATPASVVAPGVVGFVPCGGGAWASGGWLLMSS